MRNLLKMVFFLVFFSVMYSCVDENTFKEYCDTSKKAAKTATDDYDYYKLGYNAKIYDNNKKSLKDFCSGK